MNSKEALEAAILIAGGQTALAKKIGGKVRQGHVWQWLQGRVPAERCADIERAVDGKITRADLRPDLWQDKQAA